MLRQLTGWQRPTLVDESRDESKREQMTVVLRYVDKVGIIQERFFDLVHVSDTYALTLKNEISSIFSRHNLDIQNLRGQGYDGASNMRGEFNGLQALFLKDYTHAYYVHCFAQHLQLELIRASRNVISIQNFFTNLSFIINVVEASSKRHDEELLKQIAELSHGLVKTEKSEIYHLVFRLIRLVLTLPVSTTITERSFSAMKIVKTRFRNDNREVNFSNENCQNKIPE
ncbi:Dimer_Tnp_hAT domain-containing protein/DUF4371 domain-containing protein [Cephalotus follicularis]|uniref:Dimer_Tnp_hAT domain-containing protein/DUF4371 domain-containing protein n=1 Tax=Cephalotus follicularis TaxID=3775 RepID=A0A1Q3BAV3_CEPFO|nr:Dimer_Tnp_hAT domain-containing protein/DUF4371 domain-containing protein [Cephalotus follicularis]